MVAEIPDTPPDSDVDDVVSGRTWPSKAVDRFIVGHLHGPYDLKQSCLHLGLVYEGFDSIDVGELQHFWSVVLPSTTHLSYWNRRARDDVKVQKILEEIKALMDDALEFFAATHEDYKVV